MFPMIFAIGIEIGFAYPSFQWNNNAKGQADVTVSVIGMRVIRSGAKYLYVNDLQIEAQNINGYLADGEDVAISARSKPLSSLPIMTRGSSPVDGGNLLLDSSEMRGLLNAAPASFAYVRRLMGSEEFINGIDRYCLWVGDSEREDASSIPEIDARFMAAAESRLRSPKLQTQVLASVPHRFGEIRYRQEPSIVVPSISSGLREYIPIGCVGADVVLTKNAFAVYGAGPWALALITSRTHMVWVHAVCGRMRINFSYANTIVYNNFPVPPLSDAVKEQLTVAALRVLDVREYHCEKTLADLYDPDQMPADLRAAHAAVDELVDSIYSNRGYETDEQRLSDLFAMYERMTSEEAVKAPAKKTRGIGK